MKFILVILLGASLCSCCIDNWHKYDTAPYETIVTVRDHRGCFRVIPHPEDKNRALVNDCSSTWARFGRDAASILTLGVATIRPGHPEDFVSVAEEATGRKVQSVRHFAPYCDDSVNGYEVTLAP